MNKEQGGLAFFKRFDERKFQAKCFGRPMYFWHLLKGVYIAHNHMYVYNVHIYNVYYMADDNVSQFG